MSSMPAMDNGGSTPVLAASTEPIALHDAQLSGLPNELLVKIFEEQFTIDDALHLGFACKRFYDVLDENRLRVMKEVIMGSAVYRDDVLLCRFIDAFSPWAASHMAEPILWEHTIALPDHPTVADFAMQVEELYDGYEGPLAPSDEQVWDIVTRWHALKEFAKLYKDPNIHASFRTSNVNNLESLFDITALSDAQRSEYQREYHHSCAVCVPEHKRWKHSSESAACVHRNSQICQHDIGTDLKYTLERAMPGLKRDDFPYYRSHMAITRYWVVAESARYLKICRATDDDPEAEAKMWLNTVFYRRGLTVQQTMDIAEMCGFIQAFLLSHAQFANLRHWDEWSMDFEREIYQDQGSFEPDDNEDRFSFTSTARLCVMPGDIFELISVGENGVHASKRSLTWPNTRKAAYLRLRGVYYDPDFLSRTFENECTGKYTEVLANYCDWVSHLGWILEECVPTSHIPVRRLWNDYAARHWSRMLRGRVLAISDDYTEAMPYLIQNALLGGHNFTAPSGAEILTQLGKVQRRSRAAQKQMERKR